MAARGWGRVINISSIVGRIGNFGQANYAAAKAGLIGFTKTLAREYARKGVTVNAIAPGFVQTRMLDGVPDKAMEAVLATTPVGRLGDPMEIAASVALPRLAGRRLRDRARARHQRRHGDVSAGRTPRRNAHDGEQRWRRTVARRGPGPPSRRLLGEQQRLLRNMLCAPARRRHRPADARRHHAHDVVLEEGTHHAAPLPRETPATQAEPVLLCYALVNRPYILDLQPDKSVVRQYLDRGFDVYMIDWGVPSRRRSRR